ncbi:uncharacterized protein G2W53_017722 [Senna tora]|uniref:Uncharacterized protein n=1 Tax=Senna tora TaxID=362788 RepID=A0A834TPS0_9FABA|nr:uncharacterized protein G2W53_017722 [Senna tora]
MYNSVLRGVHFLPFAGLVKVTFHRLIRYFVTQLTTINAQLKAGRLFNEKVTEDLEKLTDLASGLHVRKYDHQSTVSSITLASTCLRPVHLLTHPSRLTLTVYITWRQCMKHIAAEGATSSTQKADGNGPKGASRMNKHGLRDYMKWYQRRTRRWIHPDSAVQRYTGDVADGTMSQVHE